MDQTRRDPCLDDSGTPVPANAVPRAPKASSPIHPAALVGVAAAYSLAGKLGLSVAVVHPSASAVWAPSGIALAALLTFGYGLWPALFVGAFLVNVTTFGSVWSSLGIATGNTLEGLICAMLVNRYANGRHAFDRAGDTVRFTLLAGILGTMTSATFGVASLASQGFARWSDFGPIWLTWWLGDVGGVLVVAPLLLLWRENPRLRWTRGQVMEALLLLVCLVAIGKLVFGLSATTGHKGHPLMFLCMPVLLWAAFRFDQRITSTAVFVLAAVAVTSTLRHTAPIERWELNQALVTLQVFLGVAAGSKLTFAALVAERARGDAAVRAASEELRAAMAELETFNRSISHDLRSPLGAVVNYSAAMEEDFGASVGERGLRMLRGIRASADSAAGMLDQLVQVGWAGRDGRDRLLVDMTSLARDVHAEIVAGGGEVGEVRFELRELPPVWGSEVLLRCLFRNLFSNAVKYTRGCPNRRVQVTGVAGETENAYWVADNGVGFDPALSEAMFQPFRRLNAAQYEGSGLGLAIAARIVRRHDGRIWGESDGVRGARFCFTLPRDGNGNGA